MAVDEAILEATAGALQPTTLRLYAWNPNCLSLGQSQSISDVEKSACKLRVGIGATSNGGQSDITCR
jgi:lipoate-protein ligase A